MQLLLTRAKSTLLRYPHTISVILLVLLTLSVFLNIKGHEYIVNWDDGVYVADNLDIRGINSRNLTRIFTTSYVGNYAPLHLFSYMLEYSLWGLQPDTLLITNVLLHIGSTLLFYRILFRFGLTVPQAFVAAALFAVHPVQVESVAWISQRKNTLSMFLFLASWHLWIIWKDSGAGWRRISWYIASLTFFTMALLSKSVAVILPLFFMVQELALERRQVTKKFLLCLVPYLLLAGLCFVGALFSQAHQGGGRMPYLGGSFVMTMMNMLPVFSRYLTLLIFPAGLSVIYNAPIKSVPDITVLLSAVVFILFTFGWIRLWKQHRRHFFWLTLFIIGLLPVSNVIPIAAMMNDRYLYYPMLGIAPFAILSITGAVDCIGKRLPLPRQCILMFIATVFITSYGLASRQRLEVWKDSQTLWSDALNKSENGVWYSADANFLNYMYTDSLVDHARELNKRGNKSEAHKAYLLALAYDDTNYDALLEISEYYIAREQPLTARPYLVRLTDVYKRSDEGHFLLGDSLANSGETDMAKEEFRKALALNPLHERAAKALKQLEENPGK